MGNLCLKKKESNETIVNESGSLLKRVNDNEFQFWEEMEKLNLVKISQFNKSKKTVEFGFSNLFIENFIPLGQIMEYLVTEQNFFYFISLFEITLAIVDFLQVIFTLKKKHNLDKNFFFINFEKFYLMKGDDGLYSKLVYLDEKLNENYNLAEIIYRDDNNMLSSFSIMEDTGKSMQFLLSTMNSTNLRTTVSIDLNSFFYSKCNDRYQNLRNNFSIQNCEKFYVENIITFISRSLIKKVTIFQQDLEHDFNNLKYILRHTINNYFKNNELNLQNLKIILSNLYINNFEFNHFKNVLEEKLNNNQNYSMDRMLMEKIISFKQSGISLLYGECDVELEDKHLHRIVFIHDYFIDEKLNKSANICINCVSSIIAKKSPDGRSNYISLNQFEDELIKKHSFIDLIHFLKYLCCYFESDDKTREILSERGEDIQIYRKNKNCVMFEYIEWDEYREAALKNVILNLDFNVKNNLKKKIVKNDKSLILPMK